MCLTTAGIIGYWLAITTTHIAGKLKAEYKDILDEGIDKSIDYLSTEGPMLITDTQQVISDASLYWLGF